MAEVIVSFKAEVEGFQAELKKAEQSVMGVDDAAAKAASDTSRKFADAAKRITKSTKDIEKGVKAAFNGKTLEAFIKEATRSGQSLEELKKSLRDLKAAALNVEPNTQAFKDLTAAAGALTDKISDINQRIKNLASDTQRLDALIQVGQGIAGGFALAQGAAALLGKESEDLQKTLVKLQAAQNILNGLQQVATVLNKDSAASTYILGAAQRAYTAIVGTSTGALKAFRIALAATGIGAITVAVGMLIANWEKLTEAIRNSLSSLGLMSKATESLSEKYSRLNNEIELQIAKAEAQGKSEREILELKKEALKLRAKEAFLIKDEKEREEALNKIKIDFYRLQKEKRQIDEREEEERRKKAEERRKRELEKLKEKNKIERIESIKAKVEVEKEEPELKPREELIKNEELYNELFKKAVEDRIKMREMELQVAEEITNSLMSLNQLILEDSVQGAAVAKALALFQIGLDTAKAIGTITAEMAKGNLTPVEYALKVASGIAIVTANMAKAKAILNQTEVPKYAEGTDRVTGGVKGKDSVPALLMPDEAVIKAKENMKYVGLAKAWNAGKLEDYINERWVLPAVIEVQRKYETLQQKTLAQNIANSLIFNDANIIRAHKLGIRTQWETAQYLAKEIRKIKRNPYSPLQ